MAGNDNIFMDKIKLSALVVDKEGQLIGLYARLLKRYRAKYLSKDTIIETEDYTESWRLINELYSFLKYNKIEKQKKKDEVKYNQLGEIMKRYNNIDSNISFKDLQLAYNLILEFISLSGYHDDEVFSAEIDDEPQYW